MIFSHGYSSEKYGNYAGTCLDRVNKLIVCVAVTLGMYLLGVNKLIVCVAVTGMYLLGVNKLIVCVAVTGVFVSPT